MDATYEAARAFGHVLLDGVSAVEVDESGEGVNLAIQRAFEVDAITTTTDDSGDVTLDVSAAISGALTLVQGLLIMLRSATGHDDDFVLAEAREFFDRICRSPEE